MCLFILIFVSNLEVIRKSMVKAIFFDIDGRWSVLRHMKYPALPLTHWISYGRKVLKVL